MFIIHRQTLYVVNDASITSNAAKALQAALFVHVDANAAEGASPQLTPGTSMPGLLRDLNTLLDLTAERSTKVFDAVDIVGRDDGELMDTLGDVLLGSPVAFVR